MFKLNRIVAVAATALTMTSAAVATAQALPWRDQRPAYDSSRLTSSYVDSLDWKITNAAQNRVISWSEARDLRDQLRSVQNLAWRVQNHQASDREFRRLNLVVTRVETAITRYAANDRYDRNGRSDRQEYRYRR